MENFQENLKKIQSVLLAVAFLALVYTYFVENTITQLPIFRSNPEQTEK